MSFVENIKEYVDEVKDLKEQYPEEFDAALDLGKALIDKIRDKDFKYEDVNYESLGKVEAMQLSRLLIRKTREENEELARKVDIVGRLIGQVLVKAVQGAAPNFG